jgi:hypothetical protein
VKVGDRVRFVGKIPGGPSVDPLRVGATGTIKQALGPGNKYPYLIEWDEESVEEDGDEELRMAPSEIEPVSNNWKKYVESLESKK